MVVLFSHVVLFTLNNFLEAFGSIHHYLFKFFKKYSQFFWLLWFHSMPLSLLSPKPFTQSVQFLCTRILGCWSPTSSPDSQGVFFCLHSRYVSWRWHLHYRLTITQTLTNPNLNAPPRRLSWVSLRISNSQTASRTFHWRLKVNTSPAQLHHLCLQPCPPSWVPCLSEWCHHPPSWIWSLQTINHSSTPPRLFSFSVPTTANTLFPISHWDPFSDQSVHSFSFLLIL